MLCVLSLSPHLPRRHQEDVPLAVVPSVEPHSKGQAD